MTVGQLRELLNSYPLDVDDYTVAFSDAATLVADAHTVSIDHDKDVVMLHHAPQHSGHIHVPAN